MEDNLVFNIFFHLVKLFSYDVKTLVGVVVLGYDLTDYGFLTGRMLEG